MSKTQPEPIRDPQTDHLLTPENSVVVFIDYQETQYRTVTSSTEARIKLNTRLLAETATRWGAPVVVSTVGVDLGVNQPTPQELMQYMPEGTKQIDRTGVNSWEDADFRAAIEATGRKKVIIAGLWTEVCVAFPTLDMLKEGYEVYPVVDAIGGISTAAHDAAITRMVTAGAQPVNALQVASEYMRNWAREESDHLREIMGWYFPAKIELDKKEL